MCRLSAEMFAVTGGSGAFATAAAFAKAHWDAMRDRKAFPTGEGTREPDMNRKMSTQGNLQSRSNRYKAAH